MAEPFRKADRALSEVLVSDSLSTVTSEMVLVDQIIFANVLSALDTVLFTQEQLKLVENSVLITVDEANEIRLSTM